MCLALPSISQANILKNVDKVGPIISDSATKFFSKNTPPGKLTKALPKAYASLDIIKTTGAKIQDPQSQAALILDMANGKQVSLKSMSKKSDAIFSRLPSDTLDAMIKDGMGIDLKKYAYLGKNSKKQYLFVNAQAAAKDKSAVVHFSIVRQMTDAESVLVFKFPYDLSHMRIKQFNEFSETIAPSFEKNGVEFSPSYDIKGVFKSGQVNNAVGDKMVVFNYTIKSDLLNHNLLSDIIVALQE